MQVQSPSRTMVPPTKLRTNIVSLHNTTSDIEKHRFPVISIPSKFWNNICNRKKWNYEAEISLLVSKRNMWPKGSVSSCNWTFLRYWHQHILKRPTYNKLLQRRNVDGFTPKITLVDWLCSVACGWHWQL